VSVLVPRRGESSSCNDESPRRAPRIGDQFIADHNLWTLKAVRRELLTGR